MALENKNLYEALKIVSVLLVTLKEFTAAFEVVTEKIESARAAGLDIPDADLEQVRVLSSGVEQRLLAKLKGAAATPDP